MPDPVQAFPTLLVTCAIVPFVPVAAEVLVGPLPGPWPMLASAGATAIVAGLLARSSRITRARSIRSARRIDQLERSVGKLAHRVEQESVTGQGELQARLVYVEESAKDYATFLSVKTVAERLLRLERSRQDHDAPATLEEMEQKLRRLESRVASLGDMRTQRTGRAVSSEAATT